MAGDSSIPPLSQRVPGATKRPTPEMLIAPPMLPRALLERLRSELRAELSEARARQEPLRQLEPGQDAKPRSTTEVDVTGPSSVAGFANAEALTAAARTVNGDAGRPELLPERVPPTSDVPRLPTPPEMAKAAAALLAPYPEDITQPIPAIGVAAQAEVASPATKPVNGRSELATTDPEQQAAALPVPRRYREDITQPIPAVCTDAVTEVFSPATQPVNAQPDLAAAEAALPDQATETPADRKRRNAARAARQRRQRQERRSGTARAAPPLDPDQMIRPLFADSGGSEDGTVDEVVAQVRAAQRDWRKAGSGWRWFS